MPVLPRGRSDVGADARGLRARDLSQKQVDTRYSCGAAKSDAEPPPGAFQQARCLEAMRIADVQAGPELVNMLEAMSESMAVVGEQECVRCVMEGEPPTLSAGAVLLTSSELYTRIIRVSARIKLGRGCSMRAAISQVCDELANSVVRSTRGALWWSSHK